MSLNASLNIARQAISNSQFGFNIISNNIGNMNTPGYCRQSAAFESRPGYNTYNYASSNQYIVGEGTKLQSIMRNRDQFLDNHYREQASSAGFYTQIGTMTSVISNTMNELGEKGLQKALTDFYAAADKLAGDPSNEGYRISYASALQGVSDKFNQMSSTLQTAIKENVGTLGDPASFSGSKVKNTTDDLNSKLAQLADLNQQILKNSSIKGPANELLDKRDTLIDEISAIVPITTSVNANNTINVSYGNMSLVEGNKQLMQFNAVQGNTQERPAIIQLSKVGDAEHPVKDVTDDVAKSGVLGAILSTAGDYTVDGVNYTSVLHELDNMANAFANRLNQIQTGIDGTSTPMCYDEQGRLIDSTTPLYTGGTLNPDGTRTYSASDIKFNQAIIENPNLIAAARVTKIPPDGAYDPDEIGNGLNMALVQDMKTERLDIDGTGNLKTLNDYLTNVVSTVGNKTTNIANKATTQQGVLTQIDNQRNSLYGVNLDEEITDLIKFQRSYEAASRVFNITSQMLQSLVTLGA